ncbi:PAS domain S-box protein, partial [Rhodoferax sp.]|uniref:PAS domain-containing protein n=1 Tax=Rhodoferax sp. TaxID=50421 RepID=UPI0027171233
MSFSEEVQRLQDQLQQACRRLQLVADASGGMIGKLEFELRAGGTLILVDADETADQLLHRTCSDFLERPFLDLFPGLQVTSVQAALVDVALKGSLLEPRSLLGEGFFSGAAFNFFAFQIAPGRAVVKFWDSCGAVESENRNMRSQQQLAVVFSQSPVAISLSRESDGVYVDVNEEWSLLTGLSLADVLGRTTIDLGFWPSAESREAALGALRESGRLHNLDLPFIRPDGIKLILQLNAARIEIGGSRYILSYAKDVTAERSVQAELQASRQLLEETNTRLNQQIRLFESMESLASVGYWTSGADPASLRWSNGLYSLAGLEPGTVQGRVAGRSLIHAEDLKQF